MFQHFSFSPRRWLGRQVRVAIDAGSQHVARALPADVLGSLVHNNWSEAFRDVQVFDRTVVVTLCILPWEGRRLRRILTAWEAVIV